MAIRMVEQLEGAALDWAVAKAEGFVEDCTSWLYESTVEEVADSDSWHPTTKWAQGGPILEREQIDVFAIPQADAAMRWRASVERPGLVGWRRIQLGPTPLVAAMRCHVVAKLGESVDVPFAFETATR